MKSMSLASRARSKLALIVVASVLSVSLMMAPLVSAADYASATRYWGLDKAYGVVGDTQTTGSPGNNYFSVQFYYEIWIAMVPEIYPTHISHMQVEVDSSSSTNLVVDFVDTVYDHGAIVNWPYNPYNKPYSAWASSYVRTLTSGIEYYVYYGAVTYGPTSNPIPGGKIHAYMWWWGEAITGFAWSLDINWQMKPSQQKGVVVVGLFAPEIWFNNTYAVPPPSGGGGCVLRDTNILMANGKTLPIQEVKTGDKIRGYDVETNEFVVETVTSNDCTIVDSSLSINNGLLILTPTDQPIFTDHGWIRDPQSLKIGWKIYCPTKGTWTTIYSLKTQKGYFEVYDLRATKPDTFIGNGVLLDMK